ncbi:tetratricopeptide repeat protein [Emcibacter sp.]|uniref:tetratricopeptide repeat protein n=1 Tax=Emcibacter sp. TaxID=1979954 RepID=UPI002AA76CF2|nr:tetratricopeptide repeat protein [Emcibacter sp.]
MMLQKSRYSFFLSVILSGLLALSGCSSTGPKRVDGELVFDADSLVNMADSFAKTGDYGNALRLYQRAATENPEHLDAKIGLARTYLRLGAADAAISIYQSVLTIDPENAEAKMGISQMLIRENKPDEALDYLSQITGETALNHRFYNVRGLAYDLKGDHEQAQITYGAGLNNEPDNISLLNNLGLSFAIQGQYAPAIRILSKAANMGGNNATALQNLVMAYSLSGEEEAARKMATSFMSEEEIPASFQFYRWLKSLNSTQKAQAIFLGVRTFPKEQDDMSSVQEPANSGSQSVQDEEPLDPKKKKLMEILTEEPPQKEVLEKPAEEAMAASGPEEGMPAASETLAVPMSGKAVEKVYRVQLGSYPTEETAAEGWTWLRKRSENILESYDPDIREIQQDDGTSLYRLFIAGIEEKQSAREVCSLLKTHNIDCLVIFTDR